MLGAFSCKVVGWSMGERMTADLVLSALNMTFAHTKPAAVIHHSDQGSQYTSVAFGSRCTEMGRAPLDRLSGEDGPPTAALGSSQAPTAAVDNSAPEQSSA